MIGELQLEVDRPDVTVLPCRRPHWKGRTCVVDGDIGNATWTGRGRGKRTVPIVATRKGHAPKPSSDDSHSRTGRDRRKRSVRLLRGNTKRTNTAWRPISKGSHRVLDEVEGSAPSPALWRHRADMTRAEAELRRLAPRFEGARRQRIAPKPIFEGSHSRLRQGSPRRSTVPTAATEGTHRVEGDADGDIGDDESAPADWPTATSTHRSPGGDTGGTSHRGCSRAGRTRDSGEVERSAPLARTVVTRGWPALAPRPISEETHFASPRWQLEAHPCRRLHPMERNAGWTLLMVTSARFGTHPAHRPRVTSSQRFAGGDTGVAPHRGRWRAERSRVQQGAVAPAHRLRWRHRGHPP
jgi:hypothetical protein